MCRCIMKKHTAMQAPSASAAMTEVHTPSRPSQIGMRRTKPPRSTRERMNEINAEMMPLESAVKNAEA